MWNLLSHKLKKGWGYLTIILGSSLGAIALQKAGVLQSSELSLYDQWFRLRPARFTPSYVTLVTIDETDITRLGEYPLSDAALAQLIEKLKQHRPRVIGLNLYRTVPVEPGYTKLLQIFSQTPNLIGVEKALAKTTDQRVVPPPVLRDRNQFAATDVVLDPDGKLRRHLISLRLTEARPRTQLTLGARVALDYLAAQQIRIQTKGSNIRLGKASFHPLVNSTGGYARTDVGGYQILANFQPDYLPKISLTEVLSGQAPTQLLQDKIVLIGSTTDSIDNLFYTPLTQDVDSRWSGVAIHGAIANQLIHAAFGEKVLIEGVPDIGWVGWVFLWASAGTWIGWRWRSRYRFILGFLLGSSLIVLSAYGFFLSGWWMIAISPAVAFGSASIISRGHWIWKELNTAYGALSIYARTLELKVQDRTQELIQQNTALQLANQKAEEANAAKGRFLANVNHELRTPLSIILSCSELLGYDRSLSEKQRSRLDTINHSVKHLLDLINNVLELSRLEAQANPIEESAIALVDFLRVLEDMFQGQAIARGLRFTVDLAPDLPHWIEVDERKLRQVLINLLANALKFTEQGEVKLLVSALGEQLAFAVSDTGAGISEEEQKTLFQPFAQTKTGKRLMGKSPHQGTGLGLAISQQFVQMMGGEILVNSVLGEGSTFAFRIPLKVVQLASV
jgi:adenylate cyclase